MYFTGSKDTDNLLISHLSIKDIINFILATPNNPLWTFENLRRINICLCVIPYAHREALFKAVKLSSLDKANLNDLRSSVSKANLKNIKLFNQLSSGLFINDAFAIAIEIGNQTTIDYFLNSFELYWDGALKYVAKSGRKDWVDLVIDKGANDWVSGLEGAVEGGHLELVKFFTTIKKAGRSVDKYSGMKPLQTAARLGHFDIVKYLVENHNVRISFHYQHAESFPTEIFNYLGRRIGL